MSSEQNDLKKLKSKHAIKLPTLKVLFSEWSDDDLLFVLEEANGDLDLTIDRISEGHANQWGEVKTKKTKKEAQKAKAATTISTHQTSSTVTTYITKTTPQSKPTNDRVNRSVKAPATRVRKTQSSWDSKQQDSSASFGGSWANIASTKGQNDIIDDSWNTPSASDDWATSAHDNEDINDEQPKTWASLLKSKPKPENLDTFKEDVLDESDLNKGDSWNAPNSLNDAWNTTTTTTVNITTADSQDWNSLSEQPVLDEWSANESIVKESEIPHKKPPQEEEKPSNNRLYKQEEPVVLPTSEITELDVKFGSLHVEEEPIEKPIKKTEPIQEPVKEAETPTDDFAHSSYLKEQEEPVTSTATSAYQQPQQNVPQQNVPQQNVPQQNVPQQNVPQQNVPQQNVPQQNVPQQNVPQQNVPQQNVPQQNVPQQNVPQQNVPQQNVPQQNTPQQNIPQHNPQQQPLGMDNLTSTYSSYLPNQPQTGASGFGMNPMGNVPDYNAYSTERAAAMGYYDPTAFSHHSPVASSVPYQAREKYTQDTTARTVPQQMYPTNLPYYQYYYMPNQYNAYQQSAYGQQFMNKNMYPNMYQNTNKPTTTAAQSPYSSPYGQQSQLYTQSMGYDDLGLSDYQKNLYGQQGFLGQLNQQQPAQTSQPAQKSSNATTVSASQASSGQQQTAQQPLHHPYASNFFGQPQQMFSYQQYPQYQMGHPQAAATNRHQQQYWNQ